MRDHDRYPLKVYGSSVTGRNNYDPARCAYEVSRYIGSWPHSGQCLQKPVDGTLFCKIHQPEYMKARREKTEERWKRKHDREMKPLRDLRTYREALEKIAEGTLNDPAGFARMVLDETLTE